MAIAVFALFAANILVVGAGRRRIQLRRTGDSGNRRTWRPDGSLEWWALAGTDLGYITVGLAAPLAALVGLAVLPPLDNVILRGTGVVLAVLGLVLTLTAQLSLGASWRIGIDAAERSDLVTAGVYRVARNPIFAAVIITFAGMAIMLPNLVAVAGVLIIVIGIKVQVRLAEEPYLRRVHGAAYLAFASRVGRFIPGVGRLQSQRDYRYGHAEQRCPRKEPS
ncbi:methyltransferase family protein [Mycobacterium neglectum]|uniref:methyltransferase family protein n=1 Tax=Mycobacterium neglectum TaxID=242737 RepID=UPI000BFF087B|nr:isoprenylcysteine carboxylmethyltransferase family protein [Mycobacterium neglectum]